MNLAVALRQLFTFVVERGHEVPKHEIAMLELLPSSLGADGRYKVQRDELRTVEEYAPRFATLGASGFPWINLTCLGVIDEQLVVGVELPASPTGAARTSLNYSGPEKRVLDSEWSASALLDVR